MSGGREFKSQHVGYCVRMRSTASKYGNEELCNNSLRDLGEYKKL